MLKQLKQAALLVLFLVGSLMVILSLTALVFVFVPILNGASALSISLYVATTLVFCVGGAFLLHWADEKCLAISLS